MTDLRLDAARSSTSTAPVPPPSDPALAAPPAAFALVYRRRIALSCLGLGLFGLVVLLSESGHGAAELATNTAGGLLVALGIAVRLWSAGYIGACKKRRIVTDGPYRFIRNPLYAGSFLVAAGMCFLGGSWAASLVVLVLFPALFYATVIVEERMLQTLFGEEYLSYLRRVPRFIPTLTMPPHCNGTYHLTRPGREALHALTLVCGVLMATELMELLHEAQRLPALFP